MTGTQPPTITPGAIVRLRTGGPRMTVESVNCGVAGVAWFDHLPDDSYKLQQGAVRVEALVPMEPAAPT